MSHMEKIWYVEIKGIREGPYSIDDLKRHRRITPETLAWRPGFELWIPIKNIPELMWYLFHEGEEPEEETRRGLKGATGKEELAIDFSQKSPPSLILWILFALSLLFLIYFFLKYFLVP